jgi:chromosome segregation ATPase
MVRVPWHEMIGTLTFFSTEKLQRAKPNLGVLKEYKKREEEWMRRAQDAEDTTKERDAQKQRYDQLRKQRLDEFMAGFTAISFKLKEMYQVRVFCNSWFQWPMPFENR